MPPETPPPGGASAGGEDKDAVIKKMQEDMAKLNDAMKTRDAEYQTLKETYERSNALLQSMMEHPDGGRRSAPAGGGGRSGEINLDDLNFDELGIPKQAAEALVARTLKIAEQRLDSRVLSLTQQAQQRDQFYKDHPELVGHELLVSTISQQVQLEHPNKPLAEAFKLVAERTRAYIKRLQDGARPGGDGTPPIAGGGGNQDGHPAGGGGDDTPPDLTPDQELQEEIASRNKARGRGMNRSRSV